MSERHPTAFEINQLAGTGGLFPLGFRLDDGFKGGYRVIAHAIAIEEIADIVAEIGAPDVCVLGVEHDSLFTPGTHDALPISRIADLHGVRARHLDDETIIIKSHDIGKLVCDLGHYNFDVFDVGCLDRIEEAACAALEWRVGKTKSVLPSPSDASFFLSSHDDCYLTAETTNWSLVQQLLSRLLRQYVSAIIGAQIVGPDPELVDWILTGHVPVTIVDSNVRTTPSRIVLGCSDVACHLAGNTYYAPDYEIAFDLEARKWEGPIRIAN